MTDPKRNTQGRRVRRRRCLESSGATRMASGDTVPSSHYHNGSDEILKIVAVFAVDIVPVGTKYALSTGVLRHHDHPIADLHFSGLCDIDNLTRGFVSKPVGFASILESMVFGTHRRSVGFLQRPNPLSESDLVLRRVLLDVHLRLLLLS